MAMMGSSYQARQGGEMGENVVRRHPRPSWTWEVIVCDQKSGDCVGIPESQMGKDVCVNVGVGCLGAHRLATKGGQG